MPLQSQDCLSINIWTPDVSSGLYPVVVQVPDFNADHEFTTSGNLFTNGRFISSTKDVVFVNFNYRLGLQGFGYSPNGDRNNALHDQMLALDWIQQNIARFRGDVNDVVIIGEGNLIGPLLSHSIVNRKIEYGVSQNYGFQSLQQAQVQQERVALDFPDIYNPSVSDEVWIQEIFKAEKYYKPWLHSHIVGTFYNFLATDEPRVEAVSMPSLTINIENSKLPRLVSDLGITDDFNVVNQVKVQNFFTYTAVDQLRTLGRYDEENFLWNVELEVERLADIMYNLYIKEDITSYTALGLNVILSVIYREISNQDFSRQTCLDDSICYFLNVEIEQNSPGFSYLYYQPFLNSEYLYRSSEYQLLSQQTAPNFLPGWDLFRLMTNFINSNDVNIPDKSFGPKTSYESVAEFVPGASTYNNLNITTSNYNNQVYANLSWLSPNFELEKYSKNPRSSYFWQDTYATVYESVPVYRNIEDGACQVNALGLALTISEAKTAITVEFVLLIVLFTVFLVVLFFLLYKIRKLQPRRRRNADSDSSTDPVSHRNGFETKKNQKILFQCSIFFFENCPMFV